MPLLKNFPSSLLFPYFIDNEKWRARVTEKKRKETYIAVSLFVVGSDGFEPPKA